ncbi:MAG: cob(I)yrinic acid a,c-diamide adenosyltransferase [Prevotellaceae bacterium]|jgi:cob(I)alamin adenosyltransferase|nr:cob(I)yrinic acid a,c-diamide adenosyltransferase [Prevotellaceae bacterium]
MKIYTKTGDNGTTALIGGTRVAKCDPRIDAYGTVDELNAFIGLLAAMLHNKSRHIAFLQNIQQSLFALGAYLAVDTQKQNAEKFAEKISENLIQSIENEIDTINNDLPTLKYFVVPGGTQASATAQICRTVARRAERKIYYLQKKKSVEINKNILVFINRLSDYLFVLSRILNRESNTEEFFLKNF